MAGLILLDETYLPLPFFVIHEKQALALKAVFSSASLGNRMVVYEEVKNRRSHAPVLLKQGKSAPYKKIANPQVYCSLVQDSQDMQTICMFIG